MRKVLVLLAYGASFDIIGYPLIHIWLPVSFLDFMNSFVSPGMASSGVIVH